MRRVKYLLIGGGLASARAAGRIRSEDAEGSILIVSDEPVAPYDRPPLSKEYLRGEKSKDELLLETATAWDEQNVELSLGRAVTALNPSLKTVTLADGEQVEFEKALIATGGRPITLSLPGSNLKSVHYLRTVADADALALDARDGRKAVIVGGGFIGLEVAAALVQRGLDVTVVEALPRIWGRFGSEALSDYVQAYCTTRGVHFLTSTTIDELLGEGRVAAARTSSGEVIGCNLVCIGVGIVPNVELAVAAGLKVDNGIVVDEQLRTSHPDIYAAGDVINYYDPIFEKRRRVEHWGHAEYSGMVAGLNMAGASNSYSFLSYVWSDIFDLHIEFAGDESEHDTILTRGAMSDRAFTIMYTQRGCLTAFFAVNASTREFPILRRLIQGHQSIAGRELELQDPAFNLRSLLQA